MLPNGIPQQMWKGSPNWGPRPPGPRGRVTCIVIHCDESDSVSASIAWCQTPKPRNPNPVSYHIIVGRTGIIYGLVMPQHRAWHAGVSEFNGRPNVNDFSVGVCLSNKLSRAEEYTPAALEAAAWYCAQLMRAFPIPLHGITTHEAVARPVGRKKDPGQRFPWLSFIERVGELYAAPTLYVAKPYPEL